MHQEQQTGCGTWKRGMSHTNIMLNRRSQRQKNIPWTLPLNEADKVHLCCGKSGVWISLGEWDQKGQEGLRVTKGVLLCGLDPGFHGGIQFVKIPWAVSLRANSFSCALFFNVYYTSIKFIKKRKRKDRRTRATDLSLFSAESLSLSYGFCHFFTLGLCELFLPCWPKLEETTNRMRRYTIKCRFCARSNRSDVSKQPVGCSGLHGCSFSVPKAGP